MGIAYNLLELFEKSIEAFDYAIAIDVTFSSAYFNKGNSLVCLEKYKEAIAVFEETLTIEPNDAYTFYYLGECNEKLKNFEVAIDYYRNAIKIDETIADAWIGLGSVLEDTDKVEEGLKCVQKAVELDPMNPEYIYMLGDFQLMLEKFDKTIESYKKVSEIEPSNDEIWLDYSHVYKKTGNIETAIEIILNGIALQPENISLQYRLANYLMINLQEKEACIKLETALNTNYAKHFEFLEYDPTLLRNQQILDLIEIYKK